MRALKLHELKLHETKRPDPGWQKLYPENTDNQNTKFF